MFDVSERIDGLFNVWEYVEIFDKKEGYTAFWRIIRVFDEEETAKRFKAVKESAKK